MLQSERKCEPNCSSEEQRLNSSKDTCLLVPLLSIFISNGVNLKHEGEDQSAVLSCFGVATELFWANNSGNDG